MYREFIYIELGSTLDRTGLHNAVSIIRAMLMHNIRKTGKRRYNKHKHTIFRIVSVDSEL